MVAPNNTYSLTADEDAGVFERIYDVYARGRTSLTFPRLAIVGGQPGAGKSTAIGIIVDSFGADKKPVVASIDDARDFHLAAHEIFDHHPFEFAFYTNEQAWSWTSKLLTAAREAKNNTIYETTLRIAQPVETLANLFKAEGFAIDLHTIAVNSKKSLQGIFKRYEVAHALKTNVPRWTPIDFHDACYLSFPDSVEYLENNLDLEKVMVYRRDGTIIYDNSKDGDAGTSAKTVILKERAARWMAKEKEALVRDWGDIIELIQEREGPKPEWYVENAKRLHKEAELFAASRRAHAGESIELSRIEDVTHHHVFTRMADNQLVCFGIEALDAAKIPVSNMRLMPQPVDAQL